MQQTFTNTQYVPKASGGLTRAHPDCDALPVVNIYDISNNLIETPTVSKTTIRRSTGQYTWTLDGLKYTYNSWYYWVADYLYQTRVGQTNPQDFRWGFGDVDFDSDVAKGYDWNFMKVLRIYLEADPTLVGLLGHSATTNKIIINKALKKTKLDFPCLTIGIMSGVASPSLGDNVPEMARSVLKCNFFDKNNQDLLLQLKDHLKVYMCSSNNHEGLKMKSSDNKFFTYNIRWDQDLTTPEGKVGHHAVYDAYTCGCRFIHDGCLNAQ